MNLGTQPILIFVFSYEECKKKKKNAKLRGRACPSGCFSSEITEGIYINFGISINTNRYKARLISAVYVQYHS